MHTKPRAAALHKAYESVSLFALSCITLGLVPARSIIRVTEFSQHSERRVARLGGGSGLCTIAHRSTYRSTTEQVQHDLLTLRWVVTPVRESGSMANVVMTKDRDENKYISDKKPCQNLDVTNSRICCL